jgi:hypothetical protein
MNTELNIFFNCDIIEQLRVNGLVDIRNFLRVWELFNVHKIGIGNYGYIAKKLDLLATEKFSNNDEGKKIIKISKKTDTEDVLIVKENMNCHYFSDFDNLISKKNINLDVSDNYTSGGAVIYIDSNINIGNKLTSNYELTKLQGIDKTNSSHSKNLIIEKETNLFDCNVFHINCNNYITQNLDVLNNLNANLSTNITIKENADIYGNANILGNTNIRKSMIVTGLLELNENSILVLPKKSTNIYEKIHRTIENGSLRYNDEMKTIEHYNSGWKSISTFENIYYNSSIQIHENNNTHTANNISIYQKNNLSIEFNNITNNLNIYKPNTIFTENININGIIPNIKNNLNINKNFIANKDVFINNLFIVGNNTSSDVSEGHLRFNNNLNIMQIYNKKWSQLKFHSEGNGIHMKDNDNIEIITTKNKIICNSNTIDFHKNLNIYSNLTNHNFITIDKNTNVSNSIIFNNKSILKFENSELKAFVAPNFNTTNINDYKYLNVNDYETNCDLTYTSNIFYITANYHNFKYVWNEFNINDNFLNNNSSHHIFISSENTNCLIQGFEITHFITHTNIGETENINLIDIKNKYNILIHSNNKLIYDSSTTHSSFILKKNSIYTIQIKLKTGYPTNNSNDLLLFIRLKGLFYSDLLCKNNQVDFLYNINNNFRNDIHFSNNLNIEKIFIPEKSIASSKTNLNKLYINQSNFTINPNRSISIYDNTNNECFIIQNNNIGIGTTKLSENNIISIKNKSETHTLNIIGNSKIHKNVYVKNDIIINQNCSVTNLISPNINSDNLICKNNIIINQNINCKSIHSKNITYNNNNLLEHTHTNNLYFNNKSNKLNNLVHNATISDAKINFMNTLYLNIDGNLGINSDKCYNAFSIGHKIKPNLSIANNGYSIINTVNNGFLLENINVLGKLDNFKTF